MVMSFPKRGIHQVPDQNSLSDTLEAISLTTTFDRSSKSLFLNAIGYYFEFSAVKVQDANSEQKILK